MTDLIASKNEQMVRLARLPRRFIWPVILCLHGANHLRWPSVAYPLAAIMIVLYVVMVIAEHVVPAARLSE